MQKILCFIIAGLTSFALAEGTIVETKTLFGSPAKYQLAWTTSASGVISNTTTFAVRGSLERVTFTGAGTGTTYSATLKDSATVDVLAGQGAGISSNSVTSVCPGLKVTNGTVTNVVPFVLNDVLTLLISDAGSNKTGSVILYVK